MIVITVKGPNETRVFDREYSIDTWGKDDYVSFMRILDNLVSSYQERRKRYFSTPQLAWIVGVHAYTVRSWARDHGMPCEACDDGIYRYDVMETLKWIRMNRPKHEKALVKYIKGLGDVDYE